ncbi:hypothetical protein EDC01DRAFT_634113 [Geopyxis carbonaria]|nr:hypothetical protein EDC01DRAFT_634113 [Geopyxis carbonaria]
MSAQAENIPSIFPSDFDARRPTKPCFEPKDIRKPDGVLSQLPSNYAYSRSRPTPKEVYHSSDVVQKSRHNGAQQNVTSAANKRKFAECISNTLQPSPTVDEVDTVQSPAKRARLGTGDRARQQHNALEIDFTANEAPLAHPTLNLGLCDNAIHGSGAHVLPQIQDNCSSFSSDGQPKHDKEKVHQEGHKLQLTNRNGCSETVLVEATDAAKGKPTGKHEVQDSPFNQTRGDQQCDLLTLQTAPMGTKTLAQLDQLDQKAQEAPVVHLLELQDNILSREPMTFENVSGSWNRLGEDHDYPIDVDALYEEDSYASDDDESASCESEDGGYYENPNWYPSFAPHIESSLGSISNPVDLTGKGKQPMRYYHVHDSKTDFEMESNTEEELWFRRPTGMNHYLENWGCPGGTKIGESSKMGACMTWSEGHVGYIKARQRRRG